MMRNTLKMLGIEIDLGDVPDKPKRKYKKRKRRGSKALSAPRKDKMVKEAPVTK